MQPGSITRQLAAGLLILTLAAIALPLVASGLATRIAVTSERERTANARLYLLEVRRGSAIVHRIGDHCSSRSYACAWLVALLDARDPAATHTLRYEFPTGATIPTGGRLELELPSPAEDHLLRLARLLGWLRDACAIALAAALLFPAAHGLLNWTGRNIAPGLAVAAVMLLAAAGGLEAYMRRAQQFPVSEVVTPMSFRPDVGPTYDPGGIIKFTNGIEFWTTTKINSLGFADAEPALPKPDGTFRVLLVGDSFVDALQVPVAQKAQTLLAEELRRRHPGRKFDAVALGLSGTGQANQLPFYERNRATLRPDVVVLIFVNNDFANNSALLEALRYGFDPEQPPRTYLRPDCSRIKPVADWQQFAVEGGDPAARAKTLRKRSPAIAEALDGWHGETDFDGRFYSKTLSPAFADALASTRCAFREWHRLAAEDGFRLVVLAIEHVDNVVGGHGQINRLRDILTPLDVPLIDLRAELERTNNHAETRFKFDGHWTAAGHRAAADAIAAYLNPAR
jgi:hypothetical protein